MWPAYVFPGYDKPVNIDMEPEEALQTLLMPEPGEELEAPEELDAP